MKLLLCQSYNFTLVKGEFSDLIDTLNIVNNYYTMNIKIEDSWKVALRDEFDKEYFKELTDKVKSEYLVNKIWPEPKNIFRAFDSVPLDKVKVVILGQDPYHTPGVADGLAFSAKATNRVPPSLVNIYKEIASEYGYENYEYKFNPDLTRWAEQGVLLINNTLTVVEGQANSHAKYGWGEFTDSVITTISKERKNVVFILWGGFARKKVGLIESQSDHLILESAHPSPLSAHNGFFGNGHFKQVNEYLRINGISEIKW
jgi:uracil-DNA glycosylase